MKISQQNIVEMVRAVYCRWKIENECFNTLKNQGYHIKHNYGHGNKHLSNQASLCSDGINRDYSGVGDSCPSLCPDKITYVSVEKLNTCPKCPDDITHLTETGLEACPDNCKAPYAKIDNTDECVEYCPAGQFV